MITNESSRYFILCILSTLLPDRVTCAILKVSRRFCPWYRNLLCSHWVTIRFIPTAVFVIILYHRRLRMTQLDFHWLDELTYVKNHLINTTYVHTIMKPQVYIPSAFQFPLIRQALCLGNQGSLWICIPDNNFIYLHWSLISTSRKLLELIPLLWAYYEGATIPIIKTIILNQRGPTLTMPKYW